MNYQEGDRVFIKPQKLLKQEYWKDGDGSILCGAVWFRPDVEEDLKGRNRIATITEVKEQWYRVKLDGDEDEWNFFLSDEMIAGYAFDWGEEIEVRDNDRDEKDWRIRTFYGFIAGREYSYSAGGFCWRYARPIRKPDIKITVEINQKPAKLSEISEETLLRLRRENAD
jgi:hypothetical protein